MHQTSDNNYPSRGIIPVKYYTFTIATHRTRIYNDDDDTIVIEITSYSNNGRISFYKFLKFA